MSLQRTPSGLANLYLFFKVDRIVYCEGGPALSAADVEAGAGDEETLDIGFWQCIFETYGGGASTHYKSIGSKKALLAVASKIIDADISRVIVCLDRDHDQTLGKQLEDRRIVYTYGYSWENDVFADSPLASLCLKFRNQNQAAEADRRIVESALDSFFSSSQRYCSYDMFFISKAQNGMFRRDAPQSGISFCQNAPPTLNEAHLVKRLADKGYKRGPRSPYPVAKEEVGRVMFGKLLSRYMYRLMAFFSRSVMQPFMPYNSFMRVALVNFGESLRGGRMPAISAHYNAALN